MTSIRTSTGLLATSDRQSTMASQWRCSSQSLANLVGTPRVKVCPSKSRAMVLRRKLSKVALPTRSVSFGRAAIQRCVLSDTLLVAIPFDLSWGREQEVSACQRLQSAAAGSTRIMAVKMKMIARPRNQCGSGHFAPMPNRSG